MDDEQDLPDMKSVSVLQLEEWLIKICRQLEYWGLKFAERKAMVEQLEDAKKIIFHGAMPEKGTGLERERHAYMSPEYKQHIDGLSDARTLYFKAQVKYDSTRAKFEAVRSILSIRKQEIERRL